MGVSEADIKLLWGRAAGRCSRRGCQADLTRLVNPGNNYNVGEMAHVIAHSPTGPRGSGVLGSDAYDNLILLCPTCHRDVDKAPVGTFPAELLHAWKIEHEDRIQKIWLERNDLGIEDLKREVHAILSENHEIWKAVGPRSAVAEASPGSNAYRLWELRRIDRIVPNNRRIMNLIRANHRVLNVAQAGAFAEFVSHAEGFEEHVYSRLDHYPLFPVSFGEVFGL